MRHLLIALLVLAAAGCDLTGPEASGASDFILFSSNRSAAADQYDIFRMKPDGTGVENLTQAPALWYGSMDVSPDGERVVFAGHPAGPDIFHDVYVMGTDGSDRVQLTGADPQADLINEFPHWSPDGTMIAFATTRDLRYEYSVYVMNADGSEQRNVAPSLVTGGCGCWNGNIPIGWTPDGRVVFEHRNADKVTTTYVVNPDGTGLELLFGPDEHQPAWSPDGTRVVFTRGDTTGGISLYVRNADGSAAQRLTTHAGRDALPGGRAFSTQGRSWPDPWSPDGSRIAFENVSSDGARLYVINPDGTGLREITDGPVPRGGTVLWGALFNGWSPDGDRIAFTRWDGGTAQLHVVNIDGTGLTNVSAPGMEEGFGRWVRATW